LQKSHALPHAVSQQYPSTQSPLAHSRHPACAQSTPAAVLHVNPALAGFWETHAPAASQYAPGAQSASPVHLDRQALAAPEHM
jgi:hypothetical protein